MMIVEDDNPFDNPPDPRNPMQPLLIDPVGPTQQPGVRPNYPGGLPTDPPFPPGWRPGMKPTHVPQYLPNGDRHPLWRDWDDITNGNTTPDGEPNWRVRDRIRDAYPPRPGGGYNTPDPNVFPSGRPGVEGRPVVPLNNPEGIPLPGPEGGPNQPDLPFKPTTPTTAPVPDVPPASTTPTRKPSPSWWRRFFRNLPGPL
jgi:hypothetical protein